MPRYPITNYLVVTWVSKTFPSYGGRALFSEEDDKLLVKYLATYNPKPTGRSGNRLYKTLTENVSSLTVPTRLLMFSYLSSFFCRPKTNGTGLNDIHGRLGGTDMSSDKIISTRGSKPT